MLLTGKHKHKWTVIAYGYSKFAQGRTMATVRRCICGAKQKRVYNCQSKRWKWQNLPMPMSPVARTECLGEINNEG